jgi:hypothetical protein
VQEPMPSQDQQPPEVEGFRRLLAAKQLTTGEADQAGEGYEHVERPMVSLFAPNQPVPASPIAAPRPAGQPQRDTALPTPRRKRPAWLLLILTLVLVVGLVWVRSCRRSRVSCHHLHLVIPP